MLDPRFVLNHLSEVKQGLHTRGEAFDFEELTHLDHERRRLQQDYDELRHQQSQAGAEISRLQKEKKDASDVIAQMRNVSARTKEISEQRNDVEQRLNQLVLRLPNLPHETTPIGTDETANRTIRELGKIPQFDFPPQEHWKLGEDLNILDFKRAAKVSGSRFVFRRGVGARL